MLQRLDLRVLRLASEHAYHIIGFAQKVSSQTPN